MNLLGGKRLTMADQIIKIETSSINLGQFLKWAAIVGSGIEAKFLISEGMVSVNEEIETQRGRKLVSGDRVTVRKQNYIVSHE